MRTNSISDILDILEKRKQNAYLTYRDLSEDLERKYGEMFRLIANERELEMWSYAREELEKAHDLLRDYVNHNWN